MTLLRICPPEEIDQVRTAPLDPDTLAKAGDIVDEVRERGVRAMRDFAERFGDLDPGQKAIVGRADLQAALDRLPADRRAVLERTAERIETFARAQREALTDLQLPIPGGTVGHRVIPVDRAGCYAPGGRFPLPSSVLMTAISARAAGVREVFVASPNPTDETLAAAAIAGADGLLQVGGAQAVAAMAFGLEGLLPPCDVIVGPGNKWVTAAKHVVSAHVRIDMLAGPSELVVLADATANPEIVAADLLAQAEHDTDALPILITTDAALLPRVEAELARQLETLTTAETAREALKNGFALIADDLDAAVALCDRIAPEHLEVLTADALDVAQRLRHFGGLFIGEAAAEVLGDYGAGPNHTLPTGGTARAQSGLSVFHFLKISTWMHIDDPTAAAGLVSDAEALGEMEGLEGHAKSAALRR